MLQTLKKKKKIGKTDFFFSKTVTFCKQSFPTCWQSVSLSPRSVAQPSMATVQNKSGHDSLLGRVHGSSRWQAARSAGGASSLRVRNPLLNRPGLCLELGGPTPLLVTVLPQPYSWAHPPQCCTQHSCSFLLITAGPESLPGEPQGT